jgi:hypothetical protein
MWFFICLAQILSYKIDRYFSNTACSDVAFNEAFGILMLNPSLQLSFVPRKHYDRKEQLFSAPP